MDCPKYNVLGIRLSAVDTGPRWSRSWRRRRPSVRWPSTALAVHGLMTGVLDQPSGLPTQRIRSARARRPAGPLGINWLYRTRLAERVYGPMLMLKLCDRAAREQLPVFFYGSTPEVLAALCANLQGWFPKLIIAGSRPSRFRKLRRPSAMTPWH